MPWAALAAFAVVVVLALVYAVRHSAARQEEFRQAWRRFATSRGLRYLGPSGPWYRRTPDRIEGRFEGVDLLFDTYVVSTGKSHITFSRVRGELERPVGAKITVGRRTFLTAIEEKLGRASVRTRDGAFDERRVVRSKAGDSALQVLDDDVRARILAFTRSADLEVAGGEAKLTWRGAEADPAVLDAAGGLVASLARACAKA